MEWSRQRNFGITKSYLREQAFSTLVRLFRSTYNLYLPAPLGFALNPNEHLALYVGTLEQKRQLYFNTHPPHEEALRRIQLGTPSIANPTYRHIYTSPLEERLEQMSRESPEAMEKLASQFSKPLTISSAESSAYGTFDEPLNNKEGYLMRTFQHFKNNFQHHRDNI